MTSTGVSNTLLMTAMAGNAKQGNVKDTGGKNFDQLMQTSQNKTSFMETAASKPNVKKVEQNPQMETKRSDTVQKKLEKKELAQTADVKEKTDALAKDVKKVLGEELDVTEDQIEKAMEELGLQFLDLADQSNVASLVAKLTGAECGSELLVSDSFPKIVSQITGLFDALQEDVGIPVEQLQQMMESITDEQPEMVEQTEAKEALLPDENADVKQSDVSVKEDAMTDAASETVNADEEMNASQKGMHETEEADFTERQPEVKTAADQETKNTTEDDGGKSFLEQRQHSAEKANVQETAHMQAIDPKVEFSETTKPMVELPTGERVSVQSIIDQIVEASRTTIQSEKTTVEMLLNPEGLGKVLMEVSEENGQVKAHIYTQNEQVKEALENQMFQLKEQMNQAQTKVQSVEISVGTHEFERNLEDGQKGQQEGQPEQDQRARKMRNLNMNQLDDLQGLMTQEEELVVKMMREQGNSVNYTA